MNVNASQVSHLTRPPLRTVWRSSFFWSSTVLASSLVLLSLESSLAAESAQAATAGDRPDVPSLKTETPVETDSINGAEGIASEEKLSADGVASAQDALTQSAEKPQNRSPLTSGTTEQGTEAVEISDALSEMPVAPLPTSSRDVQDIAAQDIETQNAVTSEVESSEVESPGTETVDASPTSLELGRLHTEIANHESSRRAGDTGMGNAEIEVTQADAVAQADAMEAGEASAEEISETAVTSLRIPYVIDSTVDDWSQVLTALQTEFFTSDSTAVSTSSSSDSSDSIDELTRILTSLEAEFFNSAGDGNADSSLEEQELAQAAIEYYFTPEELLDEAIAPRVTVRDPVVVALNSSRAIAWTGAEAEPDWQPLVWDCDSADCYELSESDLVSLSNVPLVPSSTEADDTESPTDAVLVAQAQPEDETATSGSALILGTPYIQLQGAYVLQGDESSARARATVLYPTSPNLLFGATVDLAGGEAFGNADGFGLDLTELYATFMPPGTSGLRFTAGLMDLTSYFDRNSFAKDVVTHFFNPVFQTNPALSAAGLSSRIGAMASWNPTDNVDVRATVFSSNRDLSEFALDAFAGEVGFRAGNLILRGTYISAEDPGSGDGFEEIFGIDRGDAFGVQEGDREEAFGLNAEYFIPDINLGLFARYGHYTNREVDESANTYSFGMNLLDLFMPDDRLGLAYGRSLSNDDLRRDRDDEVPDVLELFYDFRLSPNLRAGATIQQRNEFSETVFGFRVRADLDVTGLGRQF